MGHFIAVLIPSIFLLQFAESVIDPMEGQQILDNLLSKDRYDHRVPPTGAKGPGSPVEVNATMFVLDISEVNDFRKDFSMQFYFRQSWYDPRLRYDSEKGEVKSISLKELHKIWMPDLFCVEERGGKFHNILVPNSFLKIFPNGRVFYSVRLSMTFSCNMDLSRFPFDTQKCGFSVESYGFTSDDILLSWGIDNSKSIVSESIDLLNFVVNDFERTTERIPLTTGVYSRLKVDFTFTRKVSFFIMKLFVPFIILVAVSWVSFWIKPKFTSLRLSLLLSILFIMLSLASEINSYIPPVSYTKAIDVWTAFCLSLVFASLLGFVFVNQLSRKEKKSKLGKHPEDMVKTLISSGCLDEDLKNTQISSSNNGVFQVDSDFFARILHNRRKWSKRADAVFRFAFPFLFIIFNIIFWSIYSTKP